MSLTPNAGDIAPKNILFGIPKKGRLNEKVCKLLEGAGLEYRRVSTQSSHPLLSIHTYPHLHAYTHTHTHITTRTNPYNNSLTVSMSQSAQGYPSRWSSSPPLTLPPT